MANTSNIDIAKAIYLSSKDKAGHELSLHLNNVVKFLNRKRFLSKTENILFNLKKIINHENGIVEVNVKSTRKLTEETKKEIIHALKKRYGAKEIELRESLDERLLGGMRIEVGDEIIDLTIKNKINKLQEYLIKKA